MKLYYSPGACSLAPHIVLRDVGLEFTLECVDLRTHRTSTGEDFEAIHGKNYVPVLELDDGRRLTEGPVILQYLADLHPLAGLIPHAGLARYRVLEWLAFVAAELHKPFIPLLAGDRASSDLKEWSVQRLTRRFDWISAELWSRSWAADDRYTIADAYLFAVLRWSDSVAIDLAPWPVLHDYLDRVAARPAVRAALQAEGVSYAVAA
ncbi:glutathione transferase GstA [Povalibacter sp.]|uniref:glutathione transferase GstA n=1 Tax=Povalibacter sp. TaxID=1962978 RepID=UPI002F429516